MTKTYTDRTGEPILPVALDADWIVTQTEAAESYVPPFGGAQPELLDEAKQFKAVIDKHDFEYAVDLAKRLKGVSAAIVSYYQPFKRRLDALKRKVLDAEDTALDYDVEASKVARLAAEWQKAAAERERAAREAAERKAREEAEAEQRAKAERLKAVAAQIPDAAVRAAVEREAEQTASAPVATPKGAYTSSIPAARGFTASRVTYSVRVDDLAELVRQVAVGSVPLDALLPNQTWLNEQARAQKDALAYPGVTVLKNDQPVIRK